MPRVTIATFNAENLFTRYNFRGKKTKKKDSRGRVVRRAYTPKQLAAAVKDGFIIDKNVFKATMGPTRKLTAKTLKAVKADIVGLQEIENLDTLKRFNSRYMGSKKFQYPILIDGNDPRYIDVGLMSNYPVVFIETHQFRKSGRSKIFSRDCLEVHIQVGKKMLVVFVNHFKSMLGGRAQTRKRREVQAKEMLKILKERFGKNFGRKDFVIVGDFNDYMEPGEEAKSGVRALLESSQMENVVDRLPEGDRWTHYYSRDKSYHQLDYILISRSLARRNKTVKPVIERRGQPRRVNRRGQPPQVTKFFPEITGKSKASDHCPLAITLRV